MTRRSLVVVASPLDAERVAIQGDLDAARFPHFHCGNLDVGVFGQIFWEASSDKTRLAREHGRVDILYSGSSETETTVVIALPHQVVNRYAMLSEIELDEFAVRWSRPNGRIRMPRSEHFYGQLLRQVAQLARIARRENKTILVRTRFRRPDDKPLQVRVLRSKDLRT